MIVRLAKLDEVPQVREWLVETAKWLKAKNIPQWERFLVYGVTEVCLEDYNNNKLFVLIDDDNNLVGSLSYGVAEEIDKKLWNNDIDAYFIHRIVVGEKYRGVKYGEYMINWAKKVAINNSKEVRLNCVYDNKQLYDYYKNKEFKYCGKKFGYSLFKV